MRVDKYKIMRDHHTTFKQYLDQSYNLTEEIITGGLLKMFKRLEYWIDRGPKNTADRIDHLEQELINAGGASKFAMVIRRVPAVRHFLLAHEEELKDSPLHDVVNLL